jgi:hypothetical protein
VPKSVYENLVKKIIKMFFGKPKPNAESLNSVRSFIELPGYNQPSIEDLKLEVVLFEKRIKDYAASLGVDLKNSNFKKKSVYVLINELRELNPYLNIDQKNQAWNIRIEELHALREYRNNIIHIDHTALPSVEELHSRYKSANNKLIPFRLNQGCTVSNFKPIKWKNDTLEILINENVYNLSYVDIDNLSIQLHPASRGAVYYTSGRQMVIKVTDYDYKYLAVFVEDYPKFQVTEDEAAVLNDLILSLKSEKKYGINAAL